MTEATNDIEPITLPDPGFVYVDTQEGLAECVAALASSKVVGIDTESDSFFSYTERCCLVQITGEGTLDYIIDPLALDNLDALAPLCADPSVVKIFHGADYDVVSMKRDFGHTFTNIFDTMIAAQATGHERFGLNDLVQRYFGEKLDKKWQRHDWAQRPLLEAHLDYARKDSHFLPALREILLEQAEPRGRLPMMEEEFALLEQREWTGRPFSADDCMRVKGARGLDEIGRKVLRQVYVLREGKAEAKNRPPFKVWGNDVLLRLADEAPEDMEALRKCLGANHHAIRRYGEELLDAVLDGLDDESDPPPPAKARSTRNSDSPGLTRDDEPLVLKLKAWRNKKVKETDLGPGMIVNNTIIGRVAALKPTSVEQLVEIEDMRNWQRADFGEALVGVVTKWLGERPEPTDESGPKKKRRRRRRRRTPAGGEGSQDAGGEGSATAEAASPTEE